MLPWQRAVGVCAAIVLAAPVYVAGNQAVERVTVSADLQARSSVHLSSDTLVFHVLPDQDSATATIDYVASARTRRDGEVLLAVEPLRAVEGPGGAADVETAISIEAHDGSRQLPLGTTMVAARWTGSGSRHGRMTFRLRTAATGTYVLPLSVVLSTP